MKASVTHLRCLACKQTRTRAQSHAFSKARLKSVILTVANRCHPFNRRRLQLFTLTLSVPTATQSPTSLTMAGKRWESDRASGKKKAAANVSEMVEGDGGGE